MWPLHIRCEAVSDGQTTSAIVAWSAYYGSSVGMSKRQQSPYKWGRCRIWWMLQPWRRGARRLSRQAINVHVFRFVALAVSDIFLVPIRQAEATAGLF
jgi:hypothetical protein